MSRVKANLSGAGAEQFSLIKDELGYFSKENKIVPYYIFDFDKNELIRETILGPRNKTLDYAIEMFLHSHGLENVEIKRSKVPYL